MGFESSLLEHVRGLEPSITRAVSEAVRLRSVTGHEDVAAPFFAELLEGLGFEVDVWAPTRAELEGKYPYLDREERLGERHNVVGVRRGKRSGPTLVVNGHIDVVPAGDASRWLLDPFGGVVAGGAVHGRGACDMKGPLIAAVYAVAALLEHGFEPPGDVIVQCVIAEETGGMGTVAALERGYVGDVAVVPEPTELAICPAQAGLVKWRIEVPGRSSHTAVPWEGVSAFEKWQVVYAALKDLAASREATLSHPLFDPLPQKAPFACGKVHAGDWPYILPDLLVAQGRIGALPHEPLAELRAAFERAVAEAAAGDPWLRENPPKVTWIDGDFPGWEVSTEHPFVAAFSSALAAVTREPAQPVGVTYGTDASFMVGRGTTPVVFGAGSISHAHREDEHVRVDDLITQAQATALGILYWSDSVG